MRAGKLSALLARDSVDRDRDTITENTCRNLLKSPINPINMQYVKADIQCFSKINVAFHELVSHLKVTAVHLSSNAFGLSRLK